MDLEKQKLLLSYLISSQELYVKVSPILQTKYFDPKLKSSVSFIKDYFEKYKAPPPLDIIQAETKQELKIKENFGRQELSYAEIELETFCKNKAMEHAILESAPLIGTPEAGRIEKLIKDAITVSLNRNLGLDYFADPEARLKALTLQNALTPTGIVDLDEKLGGGINRKEMIIFAAPSGVGKSITMSNVGRNLVMRGMNGVYITLELAEEVVAKRHDSMFSGVGQREILKSITEVSIKIKQQSEGCGKLFIKRMPESSTNANHIRAYLKEFEIVHGFTPDFVIVDYLDLCASVQPISAENTFTRDKFIAEELRAIANDFNLMMITASQLNRGAQQLEDVFGLNQAHIAGGISKINTCDNLVAIIQTEDMKARGELMFKLLKTRSSNGVGHYFIVRFDPVTLRIESLSVEDAQANRPDKSLSSYIKDKAGPTAPSAQAEPAPPKASKLSIHNIPFQV
jgi:archaellum biogenesis ATPase FlaH